MKHHFWHSRGSQLEVFCKEGALENFARKTPMPKSLNSNKHLRSEACSFIEKETLSQLFSCKFCEIFTKTYFMEHLTATASSNSRMTEAATGGVL